MNFELSPEQLALRERAVEAATPWRSQVDRWDREDTAPYRDVADAMADAKLCGLTMPAKYGGAELSVVDYMITVEALITTSQSWIVAEPTFGSTGPGPTIVLCAENEATREKFLPDIVNGRKACAIALTEPDYGSDLTALSTTATPDGDGYMINGSKRFITGSPENELYATFVRFGEAPGHRGIGAVIVEKGTPGLRLERGAHFSGTRGLPHGEVHFDNCVIPAENVIRGPGHFAQLMMAFNMERIHNATLSLALAEAAFAEAVRYTSNRNAYGKPIIEFQSAYHTLVDMRLAIDHHRLLTHHAAATAVDGRYPNAVDATFAKLSGCTMLPKVTHDAMVLCGGDGTTLDFPAQRLHRDAMAALVAGGSPPVLKNALAAQLFPEHNFRQ
ncbi:acyl-CoA dehydrogenase family protein [Mycobacterium sp. CVI_P3]|uniref:Acyl-CoA dehydrogenase family protein n=1 Tax=Mycobacterium pinniadriaticum TaxID=2994102 RepID=A0ABT3SA94_9MYCO|nr:acyl-CoA dehydrogenase family protein [Mycobacterium pinniadriaticum]MCX2929897.1 acyl-CoA dehydrogenase family protein [Mycobacterium pinniadriaticum]MCX2936454.1 acyl-CoA dehydrogenase family protein [Mycobacterium pinniadriaticum]